MYKEFMDLLIAQGARKAARKSRLRSTSTPDDYEPPELEDDTLNEVQLKDWEKGQFWDYIDAQLMELYKAAHHDHPEEQDRLQFLDEYIIHLFENDNANILNL
jgi:hypothetical protein